MLPYSLFRKKGLYGVIRHYMHLWFFMLECYWWALFVGPFWRWELEILISLVGLIKLTCFKKNKHLKTCFCCCLFISCLLGLSIFRVSLVHACTLVDWRLQIMSCVFQCWSSLFFSDTAAQIISFFWRIETLFSFHLDFYYDYVSPNPRNLLH